MNTNRRIDFKDLRTKTSGHFRTVLGHYGLSPVGQGDQARIPCPFHDDEHPSCSVNLALGLWKCHAGCGEGNLLDFTHRMETRDGTTVSIRRAGLTLAAICGVELPAAQTGPKTDQEGRTASSGARTAPTSSPGPNGAVGPVSGAKTASPRDGSTAAEPPVNKPLGFALASLDPGHPYLRETRGLPAETIATFGLGVFTGERGTMLGRACIPIHNIDAELVAYAGRWAGSGDSLPGGEEKYKLPKGFHKSLELYNVHRVKHCRHITVCEGFFATISLHTRRVPAVGLMGTSISDQQIELLRTGCPNLRFLTVLLDGNKPGRLAAEKVAGRLAWHWPVRIRALPDDAQPDDLSDAELAAVLNR